MTVGIAESKFHKISFTVFMAIGTPVTLITMIIATVYCVVVYDTLQWGH